MTVRSGEGNLLQGQAVEGEGGACECCVTHHPPASSSPERMGPGKGLLSWLSRSRRKARFQHPRAPARCCRRDCCPSAFCCSPARCPEEAPARYRLGVPPRSFPCPSLVHPGSLQHAARPTLIVAWRLGDAR